MQQHNAKPFADREAELAFLERKHSEPGAKLIVIYGRRRVGKTALIKRFIEGKRGAYVLCTRDSMRENAKELRRRFAELTGNDYFLSMGEASLGDLFGMFAKEVGTSRAALALDEFPYLIELDAGVTSTLQKAWDEHLSKTGITLILCGSSVGMMERDVLGAGSPLYGRRAGDWRLDPFGPAAVPLMFPGIPAEDAFRAWAVLGGTPFYLSRYDPSRSMEENIIARVLTKGEVLFSEPMVLLREEFREPRTYALVLKQISLGYRSLGELSQVTGLDRGNLSKYLSVLEETRLVRHVLPLGQRKRGQYLIDDPFFLLWFRIAYPNMGDLELGLAREVMERSRPALAQHYGETFHRMVMELLKTGALPAPFPLAEVGQWWHKGTEIDIVATGRPSGGADREGSRLLFCECKWQEGVDPERLAGELRKKAEAFIGRGGSRGGEAVRYCLFARSFCTKPEIPGTALFDMADIGRIAFGTKSAAGRVARAGRHESAPKAARRF